MGWICPDLFLALPFLLHPRPQFISPSSGFILGSANGKQWQEPRREEEEARAILPLPGKPASLPVAVPPSPLQPARQSHWVSNFHQVTLSSGPGDPTPSLHSSSLKQWWLPTAVNFHWLHWLLLAPQLLYLLHNHPDVLTSLCSNTGVVSVSSSSPRKHSDSSLPIANQKVGPVFRYPSVAEARNEEVRGKVPRVQTPWMTMVL